MTVQEFLRGRFDALQRRDFETVYLSYHQSSPFRQQFTGSAEYLEFARQQLQGVSLKTWCCLAERSLPAGQVECILQMDLEVAGQSLRLYELALLVQGDGCWCYHSAQKLNEDEYRGLPDDISFEHFDAVSEKIRF